MKILRSLFFLLLLPCFTLLFSFLPGSKAVMETSTIDSLVSYSSELYKSTDLLSRGLSFDAWSLALKGRNKLQEEGRLSQSNIIAIADFSQSSCKKRLYVIDLDQRKILFQTYVAHGRNTGEDFAQTFSNQPSSYKSSLGFYTTLETYSGEHGLSLRLMGVEPGINNNAFDRAIVMHGADYVCADFIRENGRLGRSQGCPAVPVAECSGIVNSLKNGSCLFIYFPDKNYLAASQLLNN
ncbi:MAG: murein L,D-transpeptidase catalytic domain family protein [Chitinophagaceae bacterium]|nr:murein L,D-transpeptidase catalytic domain family protein [Chitinophagaceae bacterium]